MKTEDFERLKAICEKEGFELLNESPSENDKFYVVKKKDPWEGVEFAECLNNYIQGKFTVGKIYIVKDKQNGFFRTTDDIFLWIHCMFKNFKPATGAQYIDQLKKESLKMFGEIKEGDRFENPDGNIDVRSNKAVWEYSKNHDFLYYGGCKIYEKGKWAKRVEENIEVKADGGNVDLGHFYFKMNGKSKEKCRNIGYWNVNEFLAKQLEKYLNNDH